MTQKIIAELLWKVVCEQKIEMRAPALMFIHPNDDYLACKTIFKKTIESEDFTKNPSFDNLKNLLDQTLTNFQFCLNWIEKKQRQCGDTGLLAVIYLHLKRQKIKVKTRIIH
ncbi:MAG: hypothetical protein WC795_01430 [Candidatus Paceibacterota bacterium]|jgi:hypothetical protein